MVVLWEWLGALSISKDLSVVSSTSASTGYGDTDIYDEVAPRESMRFTARGLTLTEVLALRTEVRKRGQPYTVRDKHGVDWTGRIASRSVDPDPLNGTALFVAQLEMLLPPSGGWS